MADDLPPPAESSEGQPKPLRTPGESVLEVIQRQAGVQPRVLLRDAPGEESQVVRIHARSSEEAAQDDSRYQVLGEIGRGGVGIIFKSRDRDLGRDVAMKVLRPEMAAKPHVVERFIEEAQVAGQLQHPGVVPVYGMGLQADGRPFFTMKLVKGKTLAALLAARPTPGDERRRFLGIFEQICQTMAYAHARGVVHRDLKPANVMVGAFGEVQIMDWGFAKVLGRRAEEISEHDADSIFEAVDTVRSGSEGSQSIAGAVMGTPAYMPPEQAMGRIDALDERADVFALGSILCEILTGKPAYTGESTEQLVQAARGHLDDALARLERASDPAAVREIATACLAPAAAARPRDAGILAREIGDHLAAVQERARQAELAASHARAEAEAKRHALLEEEAKAEREQAREAQRRREAAWAARSRKRTLVLAALIIGGLLVGAGAWYGVEREREDRARDATTRVNAALREASQLRARGNWAPALDAVEMARQLAAQHIDDRDLSGRIERLGAQIIAARDEALTSSERAERDLAMITRLQEIGDWVARQTDFAPRGEDPLRVESEYANAFRGYGIDPDALEPAVAAARIHDSSIADDLTSALDDWVWVRRVGCEMDAPRWQPLLETANEADRDPMRKRLRAAIHGSHGNELRDLAKEADLAALPARTLAMMGRALIEANDPATAVRLLREGRHLHPAHVGISHFLGYALLARNPRVRIAGAAAQDDYEEALRCRSVIVAMRPETDESWMQMGNVLLALERHEEGRAAFWRAITLDPEASVHHVGVAMSYSLAGKDDELLPREYEREARSRGVPPQLGAFLLGMGLGHLQKGRFDKAIPHLESGVARTPEGEHRTAAFLAFAYLQTGRTQEAVRSAYAAVEGGVKNPTTTYVVARDQAYRQRDPDAALGTLDDLLGPWGRGGLHRMRMRLLMAQKHWTRARELLEPRVRGGGEPVESLIALGRIKAYGGDVAGAHADWEAACAAGTRKPDRQARVLAAVAWELATHEVPAARDPARALELARLAIKADPAGWAATASLAAAQHALEKPEQAQATVAAFLGPRARGPSWTAAAGLWTTLGKPDLAQAAYEEAVRRFPADAIVLNASAWAAVMAPADAPLLSRARAVELARKAVALAPKEWAMRNTLAFALLRSGDANAALAEIEIAASLRPRVHPMDAFVHAMAAWRLGRKQEARTWRERALLALIDQMQEAEESDALRARDEALALIQD